MRPKRQLVFFLLSLGLHALGWLIPAARPESVAPPVEVELLEPPLVTEAPRPAGRAKIGSALRIAPSAASPVASKAVRDFVPSFRAALVDPSRPHEAADTDEPAFNDPRSFVISARAEEEGNAAGSFLEALYAKINGHLAFDSLLAQYGHFGTVYLQFDVEPSGSLVEGSIRGDARDKILKVYVIRTALIPALAGPLDRNLWRRDGTSIPIKARFEFIRSAGENSLFDDNLQAIVGFTFSFRRFTAEGPVAKSVGDELVNGGISYDAFSMYDSWKKFNKVRERERTQFDPFARYRLDAFYD